MLIHLAVNYQCLIEIIDKTCILYILTVYLAEANVSSSHRVILFLFHPKWGVHHPLFTLNVSNFDWDGVRWLKTFWQLSFKPSWCIGKVYFENLIFKNVKNLNFKTPGSEFLSFFVQFSWIGGYEASIANFGSGAPGSNPGWS